MLLLKVDIAAQQRYSLPQTAEEVPMLLLVQTGQAVDVTQADGGDLYTIKASQLLVWFLQLCTCPPAGCSCCPEFGPWQRRLVKRRLLLARCQCSGSTLILHPPVADQRRQPKDSRVHQPSGTPGRPVAHRSGQCGAEAHA